MTIADRIKLKRLEKDLSQTELALLAGYNNKTAISKLEHAGDDISMKQIKRVAHALNVSPAFLMGWEDDTSSIRVETLGRMFPDQVKIVDSEGKVKDLKSPDDRDKLYDLLKSASPSEQSEIIDIVIKLLSIPPEGRSHLLELLKSLVPHS